MKRRQFLGATAAGVSVATLFSQAATAMEGGFQKYDRRIPSFDGSEIASSVFLPEDGGSHPVVLASHGWGGDRSSVEGYGEFFAKHGYVVLTWDQRGFGESDGEVDTSGPKESRDVSALIDFLLGENPASEAQFSTRVRAPDDDPPVGMIGGSYGGGIQLNASAVDDRIDALVPIIPWYDLRFSLAPDDVPKLGWTTLLQATGVAGARSGGETTQGLNPRLHEFYTKALAQNEMSSDAEEFFAVRSTVSKAREITADALVIQGWPDTLFIPNEGQWIVDDLNDNGNRNEAKLVLYNGGHTLVGNGGTKAFSMTETALQWFESRLRGAANGRRSRGGGDGFAPVTYYDVQAGAAAKDAELDDVSASESPLFHEADGLPPSNAEAVELSLADAAGEGPTFIANSGAPTSSSQIAPPNEDVASGATAADFDFPVAGDVELLTTPKLSVEVTPVGSRAFLFGKVYRVGESGEATLVDNQVMPVSIEGTPGESRRIDIELVSFYRRFSAGETLRLTLSTTDAGFNSARQSAGVLIEHADATLTVHAIEGAENLTR